MLSVRGSLSHILLETNLDPVDMESRNRFVFCETCGDFVYDHGLERLCGPSGKFEYEGAPQLIS
jgi:hypothetical protein